MAGQLFFIHALGDTLSPRVIGTVSDHSTLSRGLGVTLISLLVGSALFFLGSIVVRSTPTPEGSQTPA